MKMVKTSDSPYLQVKASSMALTSVLKKPLQMKEHSGLLARSKSSETLGALSIFRKPGVAASSGKPALKTENVVYNGVGGTTKVLQSDLKSTSEEPSWLTAKKTPNVVKKKKLSAFALGK